MQLWQIKGLFLNVSRHLVVTGPLNRDLFWCRGAVFYNYWLNYWQGKISQDLHGIISSHGLFLDERLFILHTQFKLHVFDMFWCLLQSINKDVKSAATSHLQFLTEMAGGIHLSTFPNKPRHFPLCSMTIGTSSVLEKLQALHVQSTLLEKGLETNFWKLKIQVQQRGILQYNSPNDNEIKIYSQWQ